MGQGAWVNKTQRCMMKPYGNTLASKVILQYIFEGVQTKVSYGQCHFHKPWVFFKKLKTAMAGMGYFPTTKTESPEVSKTTQVIVIALGYIS